MRREDVVRLKRAIESDRMSMTADGLEVILIDLKSVLLEYFFLAEQPSLEIKAKDGKYLVEIKVVADGIKTFAKI